MIVEIVIGPNEYRCIVLEDFPYVELIPLIWGMLPLLWQRFLKTLIDCLWTDRDMGLSIVAVLQLCFEDPE